MPANSLGLTSTAANNAAVAASVLEQLGDGGAAAGARARAVELAVA